MGLIEDLKDKIQGKVPAGSKRSHEWPRVRTVHLQSFPICAVCGGSKKLQVHHMQPFHLHPELELDPTNLITLCDGWGTANCHLLFGHLGNFKALNPSVKTDAITWQQKIAQRPYA